MVLLIPHHVGGACGGEGEGKVMDFWHRTGPPGPNRQRARVEDMPWGNYNSIILQYMYIVHSFSGRYALGGGNKVGYVPLASPLWVRRHIGQTQKDLKRGAEDYQDCREGIGGELLQVLLLVSASLTPLY